MTIHLIRFNLLTCAHKSQTYNQELKTFFAEFCRSCMNHGIFDFASPLQMQYYTRLIFELRSSFFTAATAAFPCCCARSCTHLFENVLMMLGMNLCTQNSVLLKNVILFADHFILSTKQSYEFPVTDF